MKEKMISRFSTLFSHGAPLQIKSSEGSQFLEEMIGTNTFTS